MMFDANFSETLTDFGCVSLIKGLTKFLLYNKQQIPFTYDNMKIAVKRKKETHLAAMRHKESQRLYKKAEDVVTSLEELFDRLATEFSRCNDDMVSEVALILGGSLLSAKQVYRVIIGNVERGHLPKNHAQRESAAELLRFIVSSDDLDIMLSKPLEPTNLFLLVRKSEVATNEWFLPKPRYKLPKCSQSFSFRLNSSAPGVSQCSCKGFEVFSDESFERTHSSSSPKEVVNSEYLDIWYQAPLVLKGFKDIFVEGVSASKWWLTPPSESIDL